MLSELLLSLDERFVPDEEVEEDELLLSNCSISEARPLEDDDEPLPDAPGGGPGGGPPCAPPGPPKPPGPP